MRKGGGARVGVPRSSGERHGADAPALGAEEGRGKLRKAMGSRTRAVIHGCPNGGTRRSRPPSPCAESIGARGEPGELKHLSSRRKRKKKRFSKETSIPGVAASGTGGAQTGARARRGSGLQERRAPHRGTALGRPAGEGESPVGGGRGVRQDPEYHGTRGTPWEGAGTTPQG